MRENLFKQFDEAFMEEFKTLRERKVPRRILENFSASVERRIQETGTFPNVPGSPNPVHLEMFRHVWVPAFAVLLLAVSTVVLRPAVRSKTSQPESGTITPSIVSRSASPEISEEMAFLEELGEWSDEDDEAEFN